MQFGKCRRFFAVMLLAVLAFPWQVYAGEAVVNVDALFNGRTVDANTYSAGQPDREQLQTLSEQGLAVVINLRGAGEDPGFDEAAALEALGIPYHHLPVDGAGEVTVENARKLDALLAQHSGQPVLVHCASGNRVGALFALRAGLLHGATPEAALKLGRDAGMTGLQSTVEALLHAE